MKRAISIVHNVVSKIWNIWWLSDKEDDRLFFFMDHKALFIVAFRQWTFHILIFSLFLECHVSAARYDHQTARAFFLVKERSRLWFSSCHFHLISDDNTREGKNWELMRIWMTMKAEFLNRFVNVKNKKLQGSNSDETFSSVFVQ